MVQLADILPYAAFGIAGLSFVRGWLKDRSRDNSLTAGESAKLEALIVWKERNIDKLGEPALAMQRLVQAEEKIEDLTPKVEQLLTWKARSENTVDWAEGQRTSSPSNPTGSWPTARVSTRPGTKR